MTAATGARAGWCPECYMTGIERLCTGFVIAKPGGKAAVAVPPLPPETAAGVRQSARGVLADRGPGSTRHEHHAAALPRNHHDRRKRS